MNRTEARRGDVWWADIPEPVGSAPGFRRPVLIVQADLFNATGIRTVIAAIMTSNPRLAQLPGNVSVTAKLSGLPKDSVVNLTQILTLDLSQLTEHVGLLPPRLMNAIGDELRRVLDL